MTNHGPNHRIRVVAVVALTVALMTALAVPAMADDDDPVEQLEARIAELEAQIAALKQDPGISDERIEEMERAIEVLAEEVENLKMGEAAVAPADARKFGMGPSASKVYGRDRGVSIGGYGEALYENFASTRQDGEPSDKIDRFDLLRAVFYFGYKFNDKIVFNSEIEYEHASTSNEGSVSVEFAYLDFLLHDLANIRAGMVLVPLGFINEMHEPPVFLGARRPYVEQALIPTTWRENGVGVLGETDHISYRAYVHTALVGIAGNSSGASGFSDAGVRGGRTKGSKSPADSLAFSGRFDWFPVQGLTVGLSGYRGDAGQGATLFDDGTGPVVDATTTIWDAHADFRWRGLQARVLYVGTTIDNVEQLNIAQTDRGVLEAGESIGEKQSGWYAEVGYDVLSAFTKSSQAVIPYLRYEQYDTQQQVADGFTRNPSFDRTVLTAGVAYKPITQVVVKADYNRIENEANTGVNQFNVALGFMF